MEDIRAAARLAQEPAILLLTSAGSQMERGGKGEERGGKKKERIGACFFGKGTKELPSLGPGQFFACFMALSLPQSLLDGPGVKSEDRYMGDPCQDVRRRLAVLFCFLFFFCLFFPLHRPTLFQVFIEKSSEGEFCMINFVSRRVNRTRP